MDHRPSTYLPIEGLTFMAILLSLLLTSCGEDFYYEQSYDIPNAEWTYKDTLNFDVDIQDTLSTYNLIIDIEHSPEYAYQNNYMYIHTKMPDGQRLGKKLSIDFAEKNGKWNGKCSGKTCKLRVYIQQNAYFNQIGKYQFTLEQYMRMNPLPGIQKLSMRVQKTGDSR